MHYRSFGRHGFTCSEIGFGAWAIGGSWGAQGDADSLAALHRALDLGVTFVDTAAGYGNGRSERLIGQVLRERAAAGRAEKIVVATKTPPTPGIWPPSPYCRADERYPEAYLRANVEERRRNLGVARLDLLQLHTWTRAWNRDPTPFRHLRRLQQEGVIGLVGISTPEHDQNGVIDLMRGGWVDSVQVIYNLFEQEPAAELRRLRPAAAAPRPAARAPPSQLAPRGLVRREVTRHKGAAPLAPRPHPPIVSAGHETH
jgi:aryl-alcohol dehydrogenase-like predicted oxidoreductase